MVHLLVNTYSHLLLLAVLQVPKECPEVPSKMLNPEEQWANKAEFKDMLTHLAQLYTHNFNKWVPHRTPVC